MLTTSGCCKMVESNRRKERGRIMDYKTAIIRLLEEAGEDKLRIIYEFVLHLL